MILYIETNFLMGAATGRDAKAADLLRIPAEAVRVVIPLVCVMEAWSAFEDERKRRNHFRQTLDQQIGQLKRDVTSDYANSMVSHLEQARTDNDNLLNDVEKRLRQILFDLATPEASSSRAEFIPSKFDKAFFDTWSMEDPTDYIILATIKNHAAQNANEAKVLLTGNSKHFDTDELREARNQVGISQYFKRTETFLEWFNRPGKDDSSETPVEVDSVTPNY